MWQEANGRFFESFAPGTESCAGRSPARSRLRIELVRGNVGLLDRLGELLDAEGAIACSTVYW
jgi:hypothetical protein